MSAREFNVRIETDGYWFVGACDELPEIASDGAKYAECLEALRDAITAAAGSGTCDRSHPRSGPSIKLIAEADRMEDEIRTMFAKVTRAGGVSWSETRVLDGCGSMEECRAARARDRELHWTDLVEDENWDPDRGVGGWSFIDAIGFRYYLPAAMIRCLRDRYDCGIQFHLELEPSRRPGREFTLEKWSALTDEQCACVARFIRCMMLISKYYDKHWEEALNSHWIQWLRPER